jgi:putative methionine-R-sulfoxide reductase with GAF domain
MIMSQLGHQIQSALREHASPATVLNEVLSLVLASLQSETGTVHWLDAKTQLLQLAAHVGLPPFMLDIVRTIPVGKGIAGETVVRGGPVTMCNLQTDTSGVAKPGAKQTGVGGALCVPIRRGDAIVGTLGIGTKRAHEYTPEETAALESVARLLGGHFESPP